MMKKWLALTVVVFVFIGFCGPSSASAEESLWGKWRCETPEAFKGLIINFGSEGRGTLEIANQFNQWWLNPNQQFFYYHFYYHIETVLTTNEECPEYIVKMWIPFSSSDLKTIRILFREDGKIELTLEKLSLEEKEEKLILSRISQDL